MFVCFASIDGNCFDHYSMVLTNSSVNCRPLLQSFLDGDLCFFMQVGVLQLSFCHGVRERLGIWARFARLRNAQRLMVIGANCYDFAVTSIFAASRW